MKHKGVRQGDEATIESLEGKVWPEPEWAVLPRSHRASLRKKPLDELTPNDLRVAFNEDIGADFLKERVLEVLREDPAAGDVFDGDLVLAAMGSDSSAKT